MCQRGGLDMPKSAWRASRTLSWEVQYKSEETILKLKILILFLSLDLKLDRLVAEK